MLTCLMGEIPFLKFAIFHNLQGLLYANKYKEKGLMGLLLFANMPKFCPPTRVACDFTAPMEHTVTPLLGYISLCGVASPAAHEVAAIHPYGAGITCPACCARKANTGIRVTEAGRCLIVHQIHGWRSFVLLLYRDEIEAKWIVTTSTWAACIIWKRNRDMKHLA